MPSDSKVPKETLSLPLQVDLPSESEDDRPLDSFEKEKIKKSSQMQLDLSILLKFIKPYDGSKETLNSFLINCNNAYELANKIQKPIVFKYILCQLQGRAEIACSIKEFNNWEQLKTFLKTQFSERKHYSYLLTELQESKQQTNENISQYALKIETLLSQLLTEISLNTTKNKEIHGRVAMMEELALHHFLMGLHPRISNIIRCKSPRTLNEAINFAISEEKIQQTLYRRNAPIEHVRPRRIISNNPNMSRENRNQYNNPQTPRYNPQNTNSNLVCRYCKNPGHTIENCRKREYNNKFKNQSIPGPSTSYQAPNQFRKVNLITEQNGYDTVDYNEIPKRENLNA